MTENKFISLTQMDMSPAIMRIDKIEWRKPYKKEFCEVKYGDRKYQVRESFLEVGEKIMEAQKGAGKIDRKANTARSVS